MIMSALTTATLLGAAVTSLEGYDAHKHLDATFYGCTSYGGAQFSANNGPKSRDEFSGRKLGVLIWFEFDKNAKTTSYRDIRWKHRTNAPVDMFDDSEGNSFFEDENNGQWVIGALSDGHIADHTHWDRINFYHKVTDQPVALMSVIQEERDQNSNILLERVYHVKCDIADDENAFRMFREFAK